MAVRLSEVERKYFVRKLGENLPNTTPLNDIKVKYWHQFLGNQPAGTPFNDLEWAWMMKVIGDAGGDPDGDWSDEWQQMVLSINKTPSKYVQENQIIFYVNAP